MVLLLLRLSGHPPALATDTVIAMGLDPAIATSACSDLDKITELNTVMAAAIDLEKGASPNLISAIPIGMAMDSAAALDMDLDSNTAQNRDSNTGLVQPLALATDMATTTATDTAINLEKGVDMVLDPNIASTAMATTSTIPSS
jgi:hypothetical protein